MRNDWINTIRAFNGEPIGHLLRRIENCGHLAAKAHLDEGPVLFVGHGAFCGKYYYWLIGKPLVSYAIRELENSS